MRTPEKGGREEEEDAGVEPPRRERPSSTLALIGKKCPNCSTDLEFLEKPAIIIPDDLDELDWDYIKQRALVPKILAICLRCGFVAVECLTPVEAKGTYVTP